MKILIIGGTKFLGRHLLDAALKNDHEVTLFNRGKKYADEEIADVEQLHGDRHFDLEKLGGKTWDAVIDTCGYLPQTVKASAEFLSDKVGQYVFISSGSVYSDTRKPDYDETTETAKLSEEQIEKFENIDLNQELNGLVLGESYGALKVLCEQAAESAMPNRVLNVRAGMIVGAFDWTDRFSYWVMRVAQGGKILAPGTPENFVQLIDARDLSEWIIKMIEENATGIFNITSKPFELTFGKMLDVIKTATGSDAEFVWADEKFLNENEVAPWSEMPFYLPASNESDRNFLTMNVNKALSKGLTFRPLQETVRDVLDWRKTQDFEMRAGISAEREKELLEKLHKQ
ncbi:MAG: NAD-dependent epimerase/dehydratase family protein [Pyrinomonadaceae bacterium]